MAGFGVVVIGDRAELARCQHLLRAEGAQVRPFAQAFDGLAVDEGAFVRATVSWASRMAMGVGRMVCEETPERLLASGTGHQGPIAASAGEPTTAPPAPAPSAP